MGKLVKEEYFLLIENEVIDEINSFIIESQTISDDVMESTKRIEEYILQHISEGEIVKTYNGGTQRRISFQMDIFLRDRENIKNKRAKIHLRPIITVNCNNFINSKYFQIYNKSHTIDTDCGSVYLQSHIGNRAFSSIKINYISINFKPLPKFYEDIPHELNHIYQQYQERSTYADAMKYAKIASVLNFDNNVYAHNIANLMYITNLTEQDSAITSVYNYVQHEYEKMEDTIDDILKETDAYKKILQSKRLFDEIVKNKELYWKIIKSEFGFKSWNIFYRRMKSLIKRFERKFAMVMKKCKKDFVLYETHSFYSGDYNKFLLLK